MNIAQQLANNRTGGGSAGAGGNAGADATGGASGGGAVLGVGGPGGPVRPEHSKSPALKRKEHKKVRKDTVTPKKRPSGASGAAAAAAAAAVDSATPALRAPAVALLDVAAVLDVPLPPPDEPAAPPAQLVFNVARLLRDAAARPKASADPDELLAKRNLLAQLHTKPQDDTATGALQEEEEGEDLDASDGDDDMEDELEEESAPAPQTVKKKSHPNKGKYLIGKYDTEDPFIDDSELAWEEQRASTKDGFFVFFGPLIEKGHYASLERTNGTMKRGGIKNK